MQSPGLSVLLAVQTGSIPGHLVEVFLLVWGSNIRAKVQLQCRSIYSTVGRHFSIIDAALWLPSHFCSELSFILIHSESYFNLAKVISVAVEWHHVSHSQGHTEFCFSYALENRCMYTMCVCVWCLQIKQSIVYYGRNLMCDS